MPRKVLCHRIGFILVLTPICIPEIAMKSLLSSPHSPKRDYTGVLLLDMME